MVSECQCPTQFPMIRVSEGKYRIGDTKVLIFVRVSKADDENLRGEFPIIACVFVLCLQILRNHVMVRVGGGWDTLQHYLDKHDPCRCRAGHRSTVGSAQVTVKSGRTSLGGVCYDRSAPNRRLKAKYRISWPN